MATKAESLASRLWVLTGVRSLLMLALAIAALTLRQAAADRILVLFGCFGVADGLISLAIGYLFRRTGWFWTAGEGLFSLAVGVLALCWPRPPDNAVVAIIAAWAAAAGLVQVATAIRLQRNAVSAWAWVAVSGVVTAAIGAFFLVNPGAVSRLLGDAIGLFAAVISLVLMFGAYRLLRTQPELQRLLRR